MEIRVFERTGSFAPHAVELALERTHMAELTGGFPQGIGRDASAGDRFERLSMAQRDVDRAAPALGRFAGKLAAVLPGNHDYVSGKPTDFLAYFGPSAGERGYFARTLDGWLVIGLDSNQAAAGLDRQYAWLEATLEEHRDLRCTLVMWHAPLFSSGRHRGGGEHMRRFWTLLDAHGVDVSLHGHEHFYEAFAPLDAAGRPSASGIRSFVVGTGGARLRGFDRPSGASRVRVSSHGVLRLTLDDGAYAWQFIEVGGRIADSGQARCR